MARTKIGKKRKSRSNVFQRAGRQGWYYRFWYRTPSGEAKLEERGGAQYPDRDAALAALYAARLEKRAARDNGSIGPVPFAVAVKKYLAAIDGKEAKNYADHKRLTFKRLTERWGNLTLAAIRPDDVTVYQAERLRNVSGATVNRELAYLSALYTWAAETRLLDFGYNPASKKMGVKKYKEPKTAAKPLSRELLHLLLAKMPEKWRPWILLLKNLGVRKDVVYKLNWQDVDQRSGYIAWQSKGSIGKIKMNETVKTLLQQIGPKAEGRLYNYKTDTVLGRHWRWAQEEVSRENGIQLWTVDPKTGRKRWIRLHDLRATFGTELSAKGVPIRDIQTMMGHQNVTTTQRYVVPSRDRQDEAVKHLEDPDALELALASEKAKVKAEASQPTAVVVQSALA